MWSLRNLSPLCYLLEGPLGALESIKPVLLLIWSNLDYYVEGEVCRAEKH